MLIEISVFIIAIAFLALVIYLIVTLVQINETLTQLRQNFGQLSHETTKLLSHANGLSGDIQRKMEAFNPLFNAFSNIGSLAEKKTSQYKQANRHSHKAPHEDDEENVETEYTSARVLDALELIGRGISLWQNIKYRR